MRGVAQATPLRKNWIPWTNGVKCLSDAPLTRGVDCITKKVEPIATVGRCNSFAQEVGYTTFYLTQEFVSCRRRESEFVCDLLVCAAKKRTRPSIAPKIVKSPNMPRGCNLKVPSYGDLAIFFCNLLLHLIGVQNHITTAMAHLALEHHVGCVKDGAKPIPIAKLA